MLSPGETNKLGGTPFLSSGSTFIIFNTYSHTDNIYKGTSLKFAHFLALQRWASYFLSLCLVSSSSEVIIVPPSGAAVGNELIHGALKAVSAVYLLLDWHLLLS